LAEGRTYTYDTSSTGPDGRESLEWTLPAAPPGKYVTNVHFAGDDQYAASDGPSGAVTLSKSKMRARTEWTWGPAPDRRFITVKLERMADKLDVDEYVDVYYQPDPSSPAPPEHWRIATKAGQYIPWGLKSDPYKKVQIKVVYAGNDTAKRSRT